MSSAFREQKNECNERKQHRNRIYTHLHDKDVSSMQLRYASFIFMLFLTQNSFTVSEEENKILADTILYVDFLIESGNINEAIIRNAHLINMINVNPDLHNLRHVTNSFEKRINDICNRKRKRSDESHLR